MTSLATYLPEVKRRVCPEKLREFLAAEDLYVYTVNAFPQGSFNGGPVMERGYEPSRRSRRCRWRAAPR
ncbi:MAG TPA: hypothetical protein VHV74_25190 [Pseudonocardiaceae bacterium]|nr:hypothetical protein [Pseudonocardiaceae bacterium]